MKFYLLVVGETGEVHTYGPFDSSAERDALARKTKAAMDEDDMTLLVKVCGEVIGRLEAEGYTGMDFL